MLLYQMLYYFALYLQMNTRLVNFHGCQRNYLHMLKLSFLVSPMRNWMFWKQLGNTGAMKRTILRLDNSPWVWIAILYKDGRHNQLLQWASGCSLTRSNHTLRFVESNQEVMKTYFYSTFTLGTIIGQNVLKFNVQCPFALLWLVFPLWLWTVGLRRIWSQQW